MEEYDSFYNPNTPPKTSFRKNSIKKEIIRKQYDRRLITVWGMSGILTSEVSRYTKIRVKTMEMKSEPYTFRY